MADAETSKILRSIPPKLKAKIAARADRQGTSVNAVIVSLLAKHYGVEYEPSTRALARGRERTAFPNIVLRMPVGLRDAIERDAVKRGETDSNTMKAIIAPSFGMKHVPTGRWRSRDAA